MCSLLREDLGRLQQQKDQQFQVGLKDALNGLSDLEARASPSFAGSPSVAEKARGFKHFGDQNQLDSNQSFEVDSPFKVKQPKQRPPQFRSDSPLVRAQV